MLETGIREDSSLAKIRKEGVMRVGYAQTGPWFYKDAKTGELNGAYKDVVENLAKARNLPPQVESLADFHRGIVIVSGTTGSGKSTSLAAIIGQFAG